MKGGDLPSGAEMLLRRLFDAALAAARPEGRFAGRLPLRPRGRTIVLGAGKAAASMAAAFEAEWDAPCEGLVVTRYGHGAPTRFVEVVEAAHPVPDQAGLVGAGRILGLARSAGSEDLVVCLISGGASALLVQPRAGVSLDQKQALTRALLRSGATIREMNVVRRALSEVKGGGLARAAAPARVATYLISDVPGDDPATIGSGPTLAACDPPGAALDILRRHAVPVKEDLARCLAERADAPPIPSETHMIATPMMALEASAAEARALGITPVVLGDALEGEARELGRIQAGIAQAVLVHGRPAAPPCVLLSGGETTVTVAGSGRGGRNAEFALGLALALGGATGVSALACDTDGIDGSEDNAGVWFDDSFLHRAAEAGLDLEDCLRRNDAYNAFATLGGLITTGPTLTNVNDFRAVLVMT